MPSDFLPRRPRNNSTRNSWRTAPSTARPSRAAYAPAPPIGPVSAAWVYGLSERRLKVITGNHAENPTLDLPCRSVFAAGQRHVEVIGPLLEDEAAAIHAGVWD